MKFLKRYYNRAADCAMRKNKQFTLLELILAMGILTVIMVIMLSFFSAAQKAWMASSANAEIYENARVAMDLMTRDLQAALYNDDNSTQGIYPFWHESDSRINFITVTTVGDSTDTSNVREVKYARSDGRISSPKMTLDDLGNGAELKGGWLVRSVTGPSPGVTVDTSDPNNPANSLNKYNFSLFPRSGGDPQRVYKVFKEIAGTALTAKKSSNNFNFVVPYVVSLKFTCYNNRVQDMVASGIYSYSNAANAPATYFPYAIGIELVLLDRTSWSKWIAMNGNVEDPNSDPAPAKTFREAHQKTFTTMIYLGSRNSRELPPP